MPIGSGFLSWVRGLVPAKEFGFNLWLTSVWLLIAFVVGEVLVGFAWSACWPAGYLWGLGLTATGFVFGFLFAIPKAVQGKDSPEVAPTAGTTPTLAVNTNLEQISDWLTKIIVGVTLIEIKSAEYHIGRLADYIVKDSCKVPPSTGIAMIIFFGPFGFLGGYILTRTFFSRLMAVADRDVRDLSVSTLKDQPLPSLTDRKLDLTGDAKRAAEQIKVLSPASAARQDVPLDALAVAQLGTGSPEAAIKTLETALRNDPNDARLHYLRALALYQLGRIGAAVQALQNARASLSPETEVGLRRNIYNALAYLLLYVDRPRGFTECIQICQEYLQQDPHGVDGSIWVNLACAHGQAASFARDNKNEDNFAQHRSEALRAIKKALEISTKWLPKLISLYRPSAEQAKAGEDDLAVFRDDPEFESVLHKGI